jgi:hypothetical protein
LLQTQCTRKETGNYWSLTLNQSNQNNKPKNPRKQCNPKRKQPKIKKVKKRKVAATNKTIATLDLSLIWLKTLMKPIPNSNHQKLRGKNMIQSWSSLVNHFTPIMLWFVKDLIFILNKYISQWF